MATLRQIAQKCGVSASTVSKALNGYSDISWETISLVKKTAEEMGYFPNAAARSLKTNKTNNLGVLFIDDMQSGLAHEYFSALLESFKAKAEVLGYDITFISRNLGNRRMSYLEHCRYRKCDGVVIACVDFEDSQVRELINSDIPVVTIDHVFNGRTAILSDNVKGMTDLVSYIAGQGHTKIAFIHGEDTAVTRKRLAGFHKVLGEKRIGIPKEYLIAARYHDPASSRKATQALLKLRDPPSCIIYPDDFSFIGGMNEIDAQGMKIPGDISVAGYDGQTMCQTIRPHLTTLRQDSRGLGIAAAESLVKSIENPVTDTPHIITIPGELLPGDTVKILQKANYT
ncbi:MAG: LacI family transcriptional regulator [Oscillospiraceae bacterium]|jgi:LacI family transcriptional regulator|nr:LacI family transcriptional regulator [Oscillospiraceae bacterium]